MKHKKGDRFDSNHHNGCWLMITVVREQEYETVTEEDEVIYIDEGTLKEYYTKIELEETKGIPYENLGLITEQVGGSHYSKLKIDPYEYSMVNGLNPLQMNAIKYITRYPFKNGIEDLEKAKHTIDRLIEYETKKENT